MLFVKIFAHQRMALSWLSVHSQHPSAFVAAPCITSQRGSAWQCYIGRWLSKGKHAFFHLSAWKNQWKILKPILAQVITLVRPTNTPNLVQIGSQGAPPHSGEISHFFDFCSPFFIYFFPFPHLAYRSQFSTDSHA